MASVRDRIVAASITALNTGTPVGVPQAERTRTADLAPTDLPSILVFPGSDSPEEIGGGAGPIVRSRFTMIVECRAKGTDAVRADAAVDPLFVWVIKALANKRLPDGGGGFLNHDIVQGETTFSYEQGESPFCLAAVELIVSYQHLSADPESRV